MVRRRASAVAKAAACHAAGIALFFIQTAASAAAASAEPVTVTIGGRANQFFFVRDDTDDPRGPAEDTNATGMFNYSRLTIDGRIPLGDDLAIRGSARFIANSRQPDNTDEVYIELFGNFGRLQLGDRRAANAGMVESVAPQAFLHMDDEIISSAVRPRVEVQMRDGLTFKRFTRNATGVVYQSPRWNTLDIAVGYYPNGDTPISTAQRTRTKNGSESTIRSVGVLGNGVRYRALAGYYRADAVQFPEKVSAWNALADVFIGPFEVSGTYMNVAPIFGLRERNWAGGVMYVTGPWMLSGDFRQAVRKRETNGATFDKVERLTFQTSYKLAPGINLGGALFQSFQRDPGRLVWRSRGAVLGITVGF